MHKLHNKFGGSTPTICQFVDMTALEMVEYAQSLVNSSCISMSVEDHHSCVPSLITTVVSVIDSHHTQVLLNPKKERSCI